MDNRGRRCGGRLGHGCRGPREDGYNDEGAS